MDGPLSEGEQFEIDAVVADKRASEAIRRTIFRPVDSPPSGSQILGVRTVRITTECLHADISTTHIKGVAEIRTLQRGQIVGPVVDPLLGDYRGLKPDTNLWVIVYSDKVRKFYPQTHLEFQPADRLPGQRWRSKAAFGASQAESYDVILVAASKEASSFLSSTLREWGRTGDYRGLEESELPDGLDEKDCVKVLFVPNQK